jgi:hypothetical protein
MVDTAAEAAANTEAVSEYCLNGRWRLLSLCLALPCCRIGKRAAGPAVSFTADVLLPTSFFGPALATYVLVLVICKVGPWEKACSCTHLQLCTPAHVHGQRVFICFVASSW